MPKPKPDVRFILRIEDNAHSGGYLIATFEAAVLVGNDLQFPQYRDDPGRELVDLTVRAQLDSTRTSGDFYGWRPVFKPWELDLERAESMVKVLRHIDRQLRALTTRFGWPQDLAAFMGHMADAVGATSTRPFARRVTGDQDMSGTGYRWMDVDDLRHHLGTQAQEWLIKHRYVVADAA